MTAIAAGEVVGVFRKCAWCQTFKKISNFRGRAKVCGVCFTQRWHVPMGFALARAITLTENGRLTVRALRAEEAAPA